MKPIAEIQSLCPCWVITSDGKRYKCDAAIEIRPGGILSFKDGETEQFIMDESIVAYEGIADKNIRLSNR